MGKKRSDAKSVVIMAWYRWAITWLEKARKTEAEKPAGYKQCLDDLEAELVRRIEGSLKR